MARSRTAKRGRRAGGGDGGGLKVGLLAAVEDRQEPCIVDGCANTWTYTGRAQLENLGRNAPAGKCDTHRGEAMTVEDRVVPCRVESCERTWTWTAKRQRDAMYPEGYAPDRPPRNPKPPARMCGPCFERSKTLRPREAPCKVHGCSREATASVDMLLRAWAALGTTDQAIEPPTPRVMCEVCREFCRSHRDRNVPCVRSGCPRTWTFKTGAQLQAFLAGHLQDPARPCADCETTEASAKIVAGQPGVADVMPCVVPGCDGKWTLDPGRDPAPASEGSLPLDRMCDACRDERSRASG